MKRSKKEGSSVTSVELTDASQNGPGSGKEGLKEVSSENDSTAEAPCDETQDEGDDHPHYYNPNQGTCTNVTCVGTLCMRIWYLHAYLCSYICMYCTYVYIVRTFPPKISSLPYFECPHSIHA